jgi:hypothetical protein
VNLASGLAHVAASQLRADSAQRGGFELLPVLDSKLEQDGLATGHTLTNYQRPPKMQSIFAWTVAPKTHQAEIRTMFLLGDLPMGKAASAATMLRTFCAYGLAEVKT